MSTGPKGKSAFFYGTLMHPKILKRVIGNDGAHLQFCPALLLDYTRHKVKYVDYPGILPYEVGKALFTRELTQEERSVRGTLVQGLTARDIKCLDIFEGSEYDRLEVHAYPLAPMAPVSTHSIAELDNTTPAHPPPIPSAEELSPAVGCETYVYKDAQHLVAALWDFDDFVAKNAWKWYGKAAEDNEDITEVDRRRAGNTPPGEEGD